MFMHTSVPIICDIGPSYEGVNALMIADDQLDLFVFHEAETILDE